MLLSPEKTKLTCWPLVLPELLELRLLLALELLAAEARRSIQGTATCFPEALEPEELELLRSEEPEELLLGVLDLPLRLLPELELLPGLVLLELPPRLLLDEPLEELPLGLELLPALPGLLEFSERIAKSILPELGLMIVSLIVPRVSPEEPVTLAPIN